MTPTHSRQVGNSAFPTSIFYCILLTAVLVSLHPISCSDYWWELSKGRSVAAGSVMPSHDLLAGPLRAEGDWASGLLFYLLVMNVGVAALMCLKVAAAIFAARRLMRHTIRCDVAAGMLILVSLICARQAWEPSPLCFDTIGVLLVLILTKSVSRGVTIGCCIPSLLLMCCWSNVGTRSIVGVLIAVPAFAVAGGRPLTKTMSIALLFVAASMTPAGVLTLWESSKSTFPLAMESLSVLRLTGWEPWWSNLSHIECAGWLLLSVLFCWRVRRSDAWTFLAILLGTQVLAAMSQDNLPLAAMILAFLGTQSRDVASDTHTANVQESWRLQRLALLCLMAAVIVWTAQPWSGCGSGLGWGLDPRLAPDAFAASLGSVRLVETAHCVGIREAGLLAWHVRNGVRPFDTPRTALLNGRLRDHVSLTYDLSNEWKVPHRRVDDSWGGWWLPLKERKTTTLVVPSEDLSLITALEPTLWKPLSLNSVSIVYGQAGDRGCTQQIVNTVSLREFVDRGTWLYQTSSEESSGHVDFLDVAYGQSTVYESLRLARVFRAMEMHVAALKVLSMLPIESHDMLRQEFASNQLALGYDERIACGRSSRFRMEAFRMTAAPSESVDRIVKEVLNWTAENTSEDEISMLTETRLYLAGDHKAAIRKLNVLDAEALYAKALMMLESGQVTECDVALRQFVDEFSDHRLAGSARMILTSLAF